MSEENPKDYLTVKQVCDLTTATAEQLRYWDDKGLLVPMRSGDDVANNRKLYSPHDVQKVREILLYKHLGFKLKEIKELFDAPREKREALVAERSRALREEYMEVGKKISFSSVMQVVEPDILMSEAEMLGGYDALDDEYERNENLKMLARWMRSHSAQDQKAFSAELKDAISEFEQLKGNDDWTKTEIQIARFCDMWSKRFGWPTVGQMHLLSASFRDIDVSSEEIAPTFGESDLKFISGMFHLAWVSASLELLDAILVSFYFKWMETESAAQDDLDAMFVDEVNELGDLLCAFLGEIGNSPHLFSEANRARGDRVGEIADAGAKFLQILENAALDKDVEDYLHLESFAAVTGESFQLANDVLQAFLRSRTKAWLRDGGKDEVERCMSEWIDALEVLFEEEQGGRIDSSDGSVLDKEGDDVTDADRVSAFSDWVECRYASILSDPPEPTNSTEEEACRTEKRCRELF